MMRHRQPIIVDVDFNMFRRSIDRAGIGVREEGGWVGCGVVVVVVVGPKCRQDRREDTREFLGQVAVVARYVKIDERTL